MDTREDPWPPTSRSPAPCCDTLLIVDRLSGEVLLHKVKEKANKESFDAHGLEASRRQKSEAAKRFDRQLDAQKEPRPKSSMNAFKEAMAARREKDDHAAL